MGDLRKSEVGIRITSDPDTTRIQRPQIGSATPQIDQPLRLLLASDLRPGLPPSGMVEVDANTYRGFLEGLAPRLQIEVENRMSGNPRVLDVSLGFRTLSDFEPEEVAAQLPALRALLDARQAVIDVERGELDERGFIGRLGRADIPEEWARRLDEVARSFESPARSGSGSHAGSTPTNRSEHRSAESSLDRLFGLIDTGESENPRESPAPSRSGTADGFVDAIMGAVTGSTAARPPRTVPAEAAADLDEAISDQLNAVYNHPEFRALEAAWRGLRFLVGRLGTRKNIRLEVLPVSKDDLVEALDTQVVSQEQASDPLRPPLSAIVLDFEFSNSRADVDALEDLARIGADLQVPVLASASPSFFGVATDAGLEQLPPLRQHLSGPVYIGWQKLRSREAARYLVLTVPSFLLREPYGSQSPAEGVAISESGFLRGTGSLLQAAIMAAGFVESGSSTQIGTGAAVEGLPLRMDARGAVPLGAILTDERGADFAAAGFSVIGCRLNRDGAYLAHARSVGIEALPQE